MKKNNMEIINWKKINKIDFNFIKSIIIQVSDLFSNIAMTHTKPIKVNHQARL